MRFQRKVALVTGGGAGIGAAAVRRLAREGAAVVLFDRDASSGERTCGEAIAAGGRALFVAGDVTSEGDVARAVAAAETTFGGLDVLVNNAAAFVMRGIEATADEWRRSLEVNVIGTASVTRRAVVALRARGGGAIVNLGSISSFVAQRGLLTYSATKAALVQMTRNLALDLAPERIRVNAVCPGPVWTPALRALVAERFPNVDDYLRDEHPKIMLGRIGEPDEVASAIAFLASHEASYVTGTALMVDGGYTSL